MPSVGTSVSGLATLLGGGLWLTSDSQTALSSLPIATVNDDDSLISVWESDAFGASAALPPECEFWEMKTRYSADLCSHFTIGRLSTAPARALARAALCAGAGGVECVLSPEVGFGVPAAFINNHAKGEIEMVLAPRLVTMPAAQQHVRVSPPSGDGMTDTRTFVFNTTIRAEFFDGSTRTLHDRIFTGEAAYCVQLLRAAYADRCWEKLD